MTWLEFQDLLSKTPVFNNSVDVKAVAPDAEGLYLIGNTLFDPRDNTKLYAIKVGTSTCLQRRMKEYRISNPLVFHIDYLLNSYRPAILERECHEQLCRLCQYRLPHSEEWYLVTQEQYTEICEKGFAFFFP